MNFASAAAGTSITRGTQFRGRMISVMRHERNGQLFFPTQILFADNFIQAGQTRGQTSPIYSFTDSLSWTKGKHAFKAGTEFSLTSSNGFNFGDDPKLLVPTVTIGGGGVAVTGICGINGLIGSNVTTA